MKLRKLTMVHEKVSAISEIWYNFGNYLKAEKSRFMSKEEIKHFSQTFLKGKTQMKHSGRGHALF